MPKPSLKNPFARRRSSGNALDLDNSLEAPVQSSFRVIERPEKNKIVFDGTKRASHVPRPFSSPLQQLRGKSADDLTYHANGSVDTTASRKAASTLKPGRASGGTTHSAVSEFYQSSVASARHSSSSTLPSSVDPENDDDDELFAHNRVPAKNLPAMSNNPLPPPPSFSARAQRAFSFGLKSKQAHEREIAATTSSPTAVTAQIAHSTPPVPDHSPSRSRAMTVSSYASTAVPSGPAVRPEIASTDFGGDFGEMFETFDRSASTSPAIGTHRTDSEPMFPARSYNRQESTPSPAEFRYSRPQTASPWDRRNSRDGLLASNTASPDIPFAPGYFASNGYARVTNATSPMPSETISEGSNESVHRADDGMKRYQLRDTQEGVKAPPLLKSATAPILEYSAAAAAATSPYSSDSVHHYASESFETTPKAHKRESLLQEDESLFNSSPIGPPSRALRPVLPHSQSETISLRRLTKAQFDVIQRVDKPADAGDGDDSGNEYEEDDESERNKQLTQQRRKQEANMAVYRQQMKKVTGGGPTDLPRPVFDRTVSTSPSLHVGGIPGAPPADTLRGKPGDDNDDDDIPLGILQAHGFPSSSRIPSRMSDGYASPSAATQRFSPALPAFARHLPEDPYFGAGLVQPATREQLGFSSGASAYGGMSTPPTPGGLVGIIATEERQRQARRGSPNPVTGTYNLPLPMNMPTMNMPSMGMPMMNMPTMDRSSSMTSLPAQQFYPGMPQMPMNAAPAMQDFMQMQMQFMQNMHAMMQMQQAQQLGDQSRTTSMMAPPQASRSQYTLDPRMSTMAPSMGGPGAGYTPSIAPSERSNIGMPTRYRPVQNGEIDNQASSLTSSTTIHPAGRPASQFLAAPKSTIRIIEKPKGFTKVAARPVDNEDDETDWRDMASKRSKRASRMSKAGERVALGELYPNVE